ncbi:MAG: hypothetical protein JSR65_03095 [Proteobacteria bacterium]|nr:hypothetical protein [Pseudomonadota bacterium]
MLNEAQVQISNVQYLRHDLMIELGRLEMAMEDADQGQFHDVPSSIEMLRNKHARVSAALSSLPLDS